MMTVVHALTVMLLPGTAEHASCTGHTSVNPYVAAGYKFTEQGIQACAVNTSKVVGTTFNVNFMVFDLSIPSKNASITRTVQIIDPCNSNEYLCSDGTCSTIACDTRSALLPANHFIIFRYDF